MSELTEAQVMTRGSLPLSVTVHRTWESAQDLTAEWAALAIESGGDIYTSPTHAKLWWSYYGRGSPAIVEVRESESLTVPGRLLAVVPLFIVRMMTPFGLVRIGRLMAGDSTIAVLSPAVATDRAVDAWRAIADAMISGPRAPADALCLAPLSGHSRVVESLTEALAGGSGDGRLAVVRRELGVHTTFVVPNSFTGYVDSLEKRQRGNLRRDLNQLAKRGDVTASPVPADQLKSEFEAFVEMHTRQWRSLGKSGHFGDWPSSGRFSAQLSTELAKQSQVLLLKLSSGQETLGYEWCLLQGEKGYWRLPARVTDEQWEKLGLGRIGMVKMIEAMIQSGVREIEAGPGRYEYKVKHGAVETQLSSVWAFADSALMRLKMGFVASGVRLADYLYYRVWFLKLRQRLGLRPAALARWWTRLRF